MKSGNGRHAAPRAKVALGRKSARLTVLGMMTAVSVLILSAGWAGADDHVSDKGVVPVFEDGNPTCEGLGYDHGFRVDPPNAGVYAVDSVNTVTVTRDGDTFDWSSTLGIDAVIAKGGPNANVYAYDPPEEATSDGNLHAPINPNNGTPFGMSHIDFCFDYEVDVTKTANTSFTRTFDWDIVKTADPATWDLFTGDTGTTEYTVTVTKGAGTDSDWAADGSITIENNTPFSATITDVSDSIDGFGAVAVVCDQGLPLDLASGESIECTYSTPLPDGVDRVNTATVTTTGVVGGGSATANVDFSDPTTLVNDTVNVEDTVEGDLGEFSDTGSVTYEREFTCDDDEGTHENVATIVETGDSDDASVTVNCHQLTVTKDADPEFNRYWTWTIDKSADQSSLLLSDGQLHTVNYEVAVSATSVDDDHIVTGGITVHNPAPIAATITSVSDVVSGDITAAVDCGVSFPYQLAAEGTLNCTYSADLPDGSNRTNTATATLQNHTYDEEGNATPSGTSDFSGTAAVNFSDSPDDEIDECIDVTDTNVGPLGTVCAGDAPKTFTYSAVFGANPDADVVLVCGDNEHVNTASFTTNDNGTTDSDTWTVDATVACGSGCTLTPGYWKTHSTFGPAPYDDTWAQIGENTPFFSSGKSYYQALWTAPAGNAYYILAHAYIAAELNMINGASVPGAVQDAFDDATALFNTYTPAQIAALKGNKGARPLFIAVAGILDAYNNGLTGPGHCSEANTA